MTRLLLPLVALLTTATAHAQCADIGPGYVQINHRNGVLYGGNFAARVSCTWNAPTVLYWRGGAMCRGRTFYGRNALRQPFSCRVWNVWRR
ncbi:MAG: hypothetical protein K2X87_09375 [Gemmataceae bacterium]|nr:hypothetical protein [Gemmataceae bacterium]